MPPITCGEPKQLELLIVCGVSGGVVRIVFAPSLCFNWVGSTQGRLLKVYTYRQTSHINTTWNQYFLGPAGGYQILSKINPYQRGPVLWHPKAIKILNAGQIERYGGENYHHPTLTLSWERGLFPKSYIPELFFLSPHCKTSSKFDSSRYQTRQTDLKTGRAQEAKAWGGKR